MTVIRKKITHPDGQPVTREEVARRFETWREATPEETKEIDDAEMNRRHREDQE